MWKRVGQAIGDLLARIVLTLFYFTIFVPFGLGVSIFGDPLGLRQNENENEDDNDNEATLWLERTTIDLTLDDARRLS